MPTIVVDVMPKAELLDPQGKAVSGALSRLGVTDFSAVRIGIAIFSYQGEFNFGVTGDYDSAPDIDVLCRGIENGMQSLLEASS